MTVLNTAATDESNEIRTGSSVSVPYRKLIAPGLSGASLVYAAIMLVFEGKGIKLTAPEAAPYTGAVIFGPVLAVLGLVLAVSLYHRQIFSRIMLALAVLAVAANVAGMAYFAASLHK